MIRELFKKPSLITRIAVGKLIGFVIGLIGFFVLPVMVPDVSLMLRWGALLWYTTLGALIGVFGVFTWHPVLKLPLPWWFRAPFLGAWMNFVLVLFAYNEFARMMVTISEDMNIFTSPFWFVLEGAVVGLVIGFFATHFGGEGKETIEDRQL